MVYTATLTSNSSVFCPDENVFFICTLSRGTFIRWDITNIMIQEAPNMITISLSTTTGSNTDVTDNSQLFRGILTDTTSEGMITGTLTSLTVASIVDNAMVTCTGLNSVEGPLTITVASEC